MCAALAFWGVLLARGAAGAAPQPVSMTVHVDRPGASVSPTLYGVFFEEINHAGDGGLYAELVRNRDFQELDGGVPAAWSLLEEGGAHAGMALDHSHPPDTTLPRSLRLDLSTPGESVSPAVRSSAPGPRAAVANSGYWGIAVGRGEGYRLSLYARRSAGFTGALTAKSRRCGWARLRACEPAGSLPGLEASYVPPDLQR